MKTANLGTIAAVALGFAAVPGPSIAQQGPLVELREALQKLDANGDTTIDRDEVPPSGRAAFDRLLERVDANKNGKMEIEERRALLQKLRPLADPALIAPRFKALDKDGDGKISRAEFPGPDAQFARLDADRDGSITRPEFLKGQGAPAPVVEAAPKPAPATLERRRERILAMDKDGDGKVSRAEWQGMPQGFQRLDVNKDGSISGDEIPKAPAT